MLEVNLSDGPEDPDVNAELSRILHECADEIGDLTELEPGDKQEILDSAGARAGDWHVAADGD